MADVEHKAGISPSALSLSSKFTSRDGAPRDQVESLCDALLDRVAKMEPKITARLVEIAAKAGGEMTGLEHRIKSRDSLARKVHSDIEQRLNSIKNSFKPGQKDTRPKVDPATVVAEIGDALRYTMLLPFASYTTEVEGCLKTLEEEGFKKVKCKNYWEKGDSYQGINAIFSIDLDGTPVVFELQFHTKESFELKSKAHTIYEEFRVESDPEKKLKYFEDGAKLANTVTVPENVERIPTLIVLPPPSTLDMHAENLYNQAEKEEPAVTEAMEKIFGKQLQGLEFRKKVQTSIRRKLQMKVNSGLQVKEALATLTDCIRYTVVFETDLYYRKTKQGLHELLEAKFHITSVTNYWAQEDPFQGIYVVASWGKEGSLPIEIQIHTPESYETKELKIDEILGELFNTSDPQEFEACFKKAEEAWRSVPVPAKAARIAWPLRDKSCVAS